MSRYLCELHQNGLWQQHANRVALFDNPWHVVLKKQKIANTEASKLQTPKANSAEVTSVF